MGLLRSIRKDILWLNSFPPAVKVIGLILGISLIVGACYLGLEWWMTRVYLRYATRSAARLEILGVVLVAVLATYIAYVMDRDRESR
jgi:uncharacterized membrane protein